ncbi:hypothetical protein EDI_297440 [Entamoeba dispar SAW760]|uniref:Uncharacterized protein n=1 Tax=Entamoeba dispar (strain ATCC PRA-260 / SAW760) TaxID=370354 RepID=B0EIN3_ENTDS|nr:uncharacterized protein EDI_297440 [Entamoeba dispar SAW760]EDR25619.1 hypothetical protein EDI_297440 [Entamoeba dispar SAW760]|eukprot:EDR25619.1 hypothetical protein EDI_297440 [Entamoeba dispar SAW760]
MSKRTVKATKSQKENNLSSLMKLKSTNNKRKYILSGCYYLITKGWSFLFSKEKRTAKKLDHFFPIQKIWNQNGVIMFDENLEYDLIITETGVVQLNFDNEGIPIKKTSIETDKTKNKKKLNYNELVIMNILNEYYNKYEDIGCYTKLLYTKSSKNGVSSQQYQKLPLVNKDGEVIGVYKNEEVLEKIGTPVYNFLCSYLLKTYKHQSKGLFIGNKDYYNEISNNNNTNDQNNIKLSKEKFLEYPIFDEYQFNCINDHISSQVLEHCSYIESEPFQQLDKYTEALQQELDIISHSGSSENILSYNNIDSHFIDNQYTQTDNNVLLINVDPGLMNFENLNYNETISQNNPDFVDISCFAKINCDYLQPDSLSEMSFEKCGNNNGITNYINEHKLEMMVFDRINKSDKRK